MIHRKRTVFKDGTVKTYIRVVEGYRPGPGLPPKQRTLKSFGYLEDQPDQAAFMREVAAYDADPANRESTSAQKMYSGDNRRLNYGYKFLDALYERLGIASFIGRYERETGFRGEYSIDEIFRFLVIQRILGPDSKRASVRRQDAFYGRDIRIELPDVYRALDHMAAFELTLQKHLDKRVSSMIGRDLEYAFYDVTNYFFEIDLPDAPGELRRRGVSKEHRVDPIVQMGLFMDGRGLPVSMSLFPGNTSDTRTLQPVMQEIKKSYALERLIVVADKGLNSAANLDFICRQGDGYVVSQALRGTKGRRYRAAMLEEAGYVWNADKTRKTKLYTEEYVGLDKEGNKEARKRQVLIYWDQADADMARARREEKLVMAQRACENGAYGIKKGSQEYVLEEIVHPQTGEVEKAGKHIVRSVNTKKAEQDAEDDGYFCILTSELDFDAGMIRGAYGGLWRIEESFRILKSDLLARPVFVSSQAHIRAHFLICFVALLMVRLIQHAMGEQAISVGRIARALNAATLRVKRGGYVELDDVGGCLAFVKRKGREGKLVDTLMFSEKDEVAQDYALIQQAFGTAFYESRAKQESFTRFLKGIQLRL